MRTTVFPVGIADLTASEFDMLKSLVNSPEYPALDAFMRKTIAALDRKNRNTELSDSQTAAFRGEIRQLQSLLGLADDVHRAKSQNRNE